MKWEVLTPMSLTLVRCENYELAVDKLDSLQAPVTKERLTSISCEPCLGNSRTERGTNNPWNGKPRHESRLASSAFRIRAQTPKCLRPRWYKNLLQCKEEQTVAFCDGSPWNLEYAMSSDLKLEWNNSRGRMQRTWYTSNSIASSLSEFRTWLVPSLLRFPFNAELGTGRVYE